MTKDRKTFMAIVQAKGKKVRARVYRIKKNKPEYLGLVKFGKMFKSQIERDYAVIEFLKYNGHVRPGHSVGVEFLLETV